MHLKPLLLIPTFSFLIRPVLGIGRECCCERYTQFALDNANGIVAHCKATWANVKAGHSSEDYCESEYCVQQQSWINVLNLGKCVVAGYQCGDCANGNVGCLS